MPKKKAPEEGAKKVINPSVMGLRPEVLEEKNTHEAECLPFFLFNLSFHLSDKTSSLR